MAALRAVGVYFLYQGDHIFNWRFRQNPMPKIKDMTSTPGSTVEYITRLPSDFGLRGEQHHGIKVPLNCEVIAQHLKGIVDRDPPVDSNYLRPSLLYRGQKCGRVGSKVDDGRASRLQLRN